MWVSSHVSEVVHTLCLFSVIFCLFLLWREVLALMLMHKININVKRLKYFTANGNFFFHFLFVFFSEISHSAHDGSISRWEKKVAKWQWRYDVQIRSRIDPESWLWYVHMYHKLQRQYFVCHLDFFAGSQIQIASTSLDTSDLKHIFQYC